MSWVPLVTAPNEPIGESWAALLRDMGVPAYVRVESFMRGGLGSGILPVRIMVPEEREGEGRRLLDEMLGPGEESESADFAD